MSVFFLFLGVGVINSLNGYISSSYIGIDLWKNDGVSLFNLSLIHSTKPNNMMFSNIIDRINLPWMEDTANVIVKSLGRHD